MDHAEAGLLEYPAPVRGALASLRFAATFLASLLVAPTTHADVESVLREWASQQNATGDWCGTRRDLERHGVSFWASYTTDLAGNFTGGVRRGASYAGYGEVGVGVDLEKLAGVPGASLAASGFWASGRNASLVYVGNFFSVQEISAPRAFYLGQLSVSQSLFDGALTLQIGRLFAGDVFATSPLWDYYVNVGVNDNLNSLPANIFFPAFQTTAWGARVSYQPTSALDFVAGVYDANPNVGAPGQHGADLSFDFSYGALAMAQTTLQWEQGHTAKGLPGSVTAGAYYESSRFSWLTDPTRQTRGSYGAYLYVDQMLFRGDWPEYVGPVHLRADAPRGARLGQPYVNQSATPKDRAVGLTAWGALYVAPQRNISTQTLQAAAGLLWHGMLPGREHDVAAFSVVSGVFSRELAGQGTETVLELNYRVQLAPWLYLTPDFQYVIHPNGLTSIGDAAVLAGEMSITF